MVLPAGRTVSPAGRRLEIVLLPDGKTVTIADRRLEVMLPDGRTVTTTVRRFEIVLLFTWLTMTWLTTFQSLAGDRGTFLSCCILYLGRARVCRGTRDRVCR